MDIKKLLVDGVEKVDFSKSGNYYKVRFIKTCICGKCGTDFSEHLIHADNIGKTEELKKLAKIGKDGYISKSLFCDFV